MIFVESVGIPVPGEITLVAAGIYASTRPNESIFLIVLAAILGAFIGSLAGYLIGATGGFKLIHKHGKKIGITEPRLKLGHYVFNRRGVLVVVLGRFVSGLRAFLGLFAGLTRMRLRSFLIANMSGAIIWSSLYGFGSYQLGSTINKLSSILTYVLVPVALILIVAAVVFLKKNEEKLIAKAEEAYPGPLVDHL